MKKLLVVIFMVFATGTSFADTTIISCRDTCNALPIKNAVIATVTVTGSRPQDYNMLINFLNVVGSVRGNIEVAPSGEVRGAFVNGSYLYSSTNRSVTVQANGIITRYNRPSTPGYNVP